MYRTYNMNPSDDLIKKCLNEEHIEFYEYSCFKDVRLIGEGGYGKVYCATLKSNEITVAIKSFKNNVAIREVVKELKLHSKVDMHSNIIRLHGVTKNEDKTNPNSIHYMLVLAYADSGTLRSYLQSHIEHLSWIDKVNFALQLVSAVKSLHAVDIIHRDLHSNNILVHQKCIKLTDFGISKRLDEATTSSRKFGGIIPYMDPQSFGRSRNENRKFKFDKKSDVYSVGVLMWEISSCYPPFKDDIEQHQLAPLILDIKDGVRESPIEGTPPSYVKIYTDCWQYDPDRRPDIQRVFLSLVKVLSINDEQAMNRNAYDTNTLEDHESNQKVDTNSLGLNL
ncbi:kinase-like domain-containing protein [Gigaspora margarita]|uniref:Kinase-like domain-containing protein n=2 Tax=Gigaspora margarita TaxID=4874 RepID=A0A8H4EHN5_GIGMA|nr:kinase-like domain-containing protein [Gigaspora margarita]